MYPKDELKYVSPSVLMSSSSSSSSCRLLSSGAEVHLRLHETEQYYKSDIFLSLSYFKVLLCVLQLDIVVWVYLISLLRVLSWLWSCSLASCCSSRSLCSFFLLCSSRSISSSASSIWRFKAFRRRFNFKKNQHVQG